MGLGYSQIAVMGHKDNSSPVVTDTTFRCVMVVALMQEWEIEVVNIQTAFFVWITGLRVLYADTRGFGYLSGNRFQ